ncbi:MAG: sulfite reductase, partial [Desulfobacterales bacterium]|nr:sulfite reductase [Desulfobacterales bacterium]
FGSGGCPNKIIDSDNLIKKLGIMLDKEDLLDFLQKSVKGDLKFHHEFRVTISECPNACSQPQIKDIGIIGAFEPYVSDNECTMCQMCIRTCKEDAITLNDEGPEIDFNRCLLCGQCAVDCETETIKKKREGFRVLLGGKLGRHPRLAEELPGIFTEDEVIEIVKKSVCFYKENSTGGKRFAVLLMDRNISEVLN